jgi:hypothetical protein
MGTVGVVYGPGFSSVSLQAGSGDDEVWGRAWLVSLAFGWSSARPSDRRLGGCFGSRWRFELIGVGLVLSLRVRLQWPGPVGFGSSPLEGDTISR